MSKLTKELDSFKNIWKGGYFEGDCLDPLSSSFYGQMGYMSVLHATYLLCIRPYINEHTIALEIGPGRGGWTKSMLGSKEVYALDALPEKHNRFFEYLGYPRNVKYFQVSDFKCGMLDDNYIDYVFSFGCLCHVSFEGITEYATNLYPKLKNGGNCFWMVADYDKYNRAVEKYETLSVYRSISSNSTKWIKPLDFLIEKIYTKRRKPKLIMPDKDNEPSPGRWYNATIDRTCEMLNKIGYKIIDKDVGTCFRDPIIHFRKP